MPVARYALPDGRVARFEVPEGTTAEQAQQIGVDFFSQKSDVQPQMGTAERLSSFDQAFADSPKPESRDTSTRRGRPRVAKDEEETEEFIFRGLPNETIDRIVSETPEIGRVKRRDIEEIKKRSDLERLRIANPILAQEIENMGGLESFLVGAGQGFQTLGRGVGLAEQPDEFERVAEQQLLKQKPSAQAGKFTAEASPGLVAGGGVANIARLPLRAAATSAAAAAEGGVIAKGEGATGKQVATVALLSGLLGLGSEIAGPILRKAGGDVIEELSGGDVSDAVRRVTDDSGNLTPEFKEYLDQQGVDFGPVLEEALKEKDIDIRALAEAGQEEVAEGSIEAIARKAAPSPARIKASEELDIDVPPQVLATDRQFQGVAGGLSAIPGSSQRAQVEDFAEKLGVKGESVLESMGGTTNRTDVSDSLKNRMVAKVESIMERESPAYDAVKEAINPKIKVNTKALISQIESQAESVGGIKNLTGPTKRVHKVLSGKPTYGLLDQERKQIGEAIGKNKGSEIYRNAAKAELDQLYSQITQLQEGVANQFGAADLWREAKEISKERFTLQDQSKALFGRDLTDQMIPKLETSIKNLTGKGVKNFRALIGAIPETDRVQAVATAMSGVFAKNRGFNATAYANWFDQLNRSPTTKKELADILPKGGMDRMQSLFELADGLRNLTASKTPTGIIGVMIRDFDAADGIAGKLYGASKVTEKVPGTAVTGITPGLRLASTIATNASKKKTKAVEAVDGLIASPAFRKALLEAAKNPGSSKAKSIEAAMSKTKEYKNFIKQGQKSVIDEIEEQGFINWLVSKEGRAKATAQAAIPFSAQEEEQ